MYPLPWASLLYVLLKLLPGVHAIGQESCVSFTQSQNAFRVVSGGRVAPVLMSADDWPGVHRAAADFAADIKRVSGTSPSVSNITATTKPNASTPPIIVGTLGKSSLIDQIVDATKLDVSSINGKWEAFMSRQVANPLPGVDSAYVIIGSDKRGTIYAMYEHSEQFGVSPWYWWADVPTKKHQNIFVSQSGCSHGSPSVQYRGIFLNDEQPSLQNWAMEKFTNGTGSQYFNSPFNSQFYSKLFELMLRIKANYLWPAMWGSAFGIDDPKNQMVADFYGIVMGTSHQEPMMRSSPNEFYTFGTGAWNYTSNEKNVYDYWVEGAERSKNFESLITLGMRGDGDLPLSEETNIKLLEKVVADQREIIGNVFDKDPSKVPQVWALYKEVQGYYEDGMRVPDDVILLWSDDNWGNVRRYPLDNERNRTGGAGVYYHYDYVGTPRDYKWLTSSQIAKTHEQMSIAVEREATKIWIVNVGDLKPYELATEFFINYGWDTSRWTPTNLDTFVSSWAQREFGFNAADAKLTADVIANVTRFNARRKPELLSGSTYSLINYREADNVLADWKNLVDVSTRLYNKLPSDMKPSFFQTVHHPVLASSTVGSMWIYQGMNTMRASQARLSTNNLADQVQEMFERDWELEQQYHNMLDGKWNHMMEQTHVMYYYWQQPMANTMPPVSRVMPQKRVLAGPMRIVPEGTLGAWPGDNSNQCAQGYSCPPPSISIERFSPIQSRYIDVGAGGPDSFTFTAKSNASWVKFTPASGSVSPRNPETRVEVSVDWSKVTGSQTATITLSANARGLPQQNTNVILVATNRSPSSGFRGFVEGDGAIAIEAAHATRNKSVSGVTWRELPGYGRTLSGVTPLPRMGNGGKAFPVGSGPVLEYDFYTFNTIRSSGSITVTTMVSPSLNANGDDRPLTFAVQVDDLPAQVKRPIPAAKPGALPPTWDGEDGYVANSIVSVPSTFNVAPGAHTLKIWMTEPAVVLQKIVIDTGGVRPSYLGPPESLRV